MKNRRGFLKTSALSICEVAFVSSPKSLFNSLASDVPIVKQPEECETFYVRENTPITFHISKTTDNISSVSFWQKCFYLEVSFQFINIWMKMNTSISYRGPAYLPLMIKHSHLSRGPQLLFQKIPGVNSDHVDPGFWDVDPPAKQAIRVRAWCGLKIQRVIDWLLIFFFSVILLLVLFDAH